MPNGFGKTQEQAQTQQSKSTQPSAKQFDRQDLGESSKPPTTNPGFNTIQEQVNGAVAGLKQAELSHAAQAFERLHNQFETDTDRISQAAELLLDPRVKIATGILKAANRINDRQEAALEIPFGGYDFPLPSIPGVPDFSQFYSSAQSGRLLGHGSNSNGSSSSNNSIP